MKIDRKKTTKKLSIKQILIAVWFCISFYSIMIFAEAPLWLLAIVIANFGLSGYVVNHTDFKGTSLDFSDEEV